MYGAGPDMPWPIIVCSIHVMAAIIAMHANAAKASSVIQISPSLMAAPRRVGPANRRG